MAKSKVTDNGALGISASIGPKKPNPKDHFISNIGIKPAENGHVVNLGYQMRPEARAAAEKKGEYGSHMPDETHVFKKHTQVASFIKQRLAQDAGEPDEKI